MPTDAVGLTLIEVVVSLSLLGIVGSGFTVGLTQTLLLTQDDRIRQQATHIAERELEIARNRFQHSDETGQLGALTAGTVINGEPLPGGEVGEPIQVDGQAFTVRRTQHLITNGSGSNPCDGGASVTYLSLGVTVAVQWAANGETRSVENRTILTPQKGVEGDVGYLAAKVTNAAGAPVDDLSVSATGLGGGSAQSVQTVDGCAVFMFSTPGEYALSLSEPGYVNFEGFQEVSKSATLEIGKLAVLPFTYDQAASLSVTYETAAGHALPETLPGLTLANSGLVGGRRQVDGSTSPASVTGLWPFADGYGVWAGTCDQSDPGLNEFGYPRPTTESVTGGSTRNVQVPLAAVSVRVVDSAGTPVAGVPLIAQPESAVGCGATDMTLALGASDSGGSLATSLPAGAWSIGPGPGYTCHDDPVLPPEDEACPQTTGALVVVNSDGQAVTGPAVSVPDVVVTP